jgi:hypothetical protein
MNSTNDALRDAYDTGYSAAAGKFAVELELKEELLRLIAQTPEGLVALAKVALEELEFINTIIDEVIAKLEAKESADE